MLEIGTTMFVNIIPLTIISINIFFLHINVIIYETKSGHIMRKLLYLLLFIVVIMQIIAYFLYTSSGNDAITPYINNYLEGKNTNVKLKLLKLRLKPGKVALVGKINNNIDLVAKGDLSLLSREFNLTYVIDTNEIRTSSVKIKEHIKVKGKAVGNPDDMKIYGKGFAFGSEIDYDLQLVDSTPQNINLNMNKANLKNLLIVAGQKPYVSGMVSIQVNMSKLNPKKPEGDAKLKITNGVINSTIVKQEFGLMLPANTKLEADLGLKTNKKHVALNGNINTSLAKLIIDGGLYNIATNNLFSNYQLSIFDMSQLRGITNSSLRGPILLKGSLTKRRNHFKIDGNSVSLGGYTEFEYQDDKLEAKLTDVRVPILLKKFSQPDYLLGKLSATINFESLSKTKGTISAVNVGELNTKLIKKMFNIDLGSKFALNSGLKAKIDNQLIVTNFAAKSTMANLKGNNLQYDLSTGYLSLGYAISIPKMSSLQSLTGKRYKGKMNVSGEIKKDQILFVNGIANELDGSIKFELEDNKLVAHAEGISAAKVAKMLDYPQIFEASSIADFTYDMQTSSGKLDAVLGNARALPTKLTGLIKTALGEDLTAEQFNNSKLAATLSKDYIDFTLNARSKQSYISIKNARINKKTDTIMAKLDMDLHNKDIQATIKGNIKRPKVSLDGSNYLADKVKEKIMEHKEVNRITQKVEVEKDRLQDQLNERLGKKHSEKIKNFIDGLF